MLVTIACHPAAGARPPRALPLVWPCPWRGVPPAQPRGQCGV